MNRCDECKYMEEDRSCEKIKWGLKIEVESTEAFGEYGIYWEEHEVTGIFPNSYFCCAFWEAKELFG